MICNVRHSSEACHLLMMSWNWRGVTLLSEHRVIPLRCIYTGIITLTHCYYQLLLLTCHQSGIAQTLPVFASNESHKLYTILCYGGYFTPLWSYSFLQTIGNFWKKCCLAVLRIDCFMAECVQHSVSHHGRSTGQGSNLTRAQVGQPSHSSSR